MSQGLLRARASLLFLLALLVAGLLVAWIEKNSVDPGKHEALKQQDIPKSADLPAMPAPRALTAQEQAWARLAWQYFETNTDADTGLVQSVRGFPSTTLWDTGSAVLATIAARRLQLIDQDQFDQRVTRMLDSLARMPLVENALPNKAYHTHSLAMVGYDNQPAPDGSGWSALDLGRLLVPLHILAWEQPQHTPAIRKFLTRVEFKRLLADGQLQGGAPDGDGRFKAVQEGRLGYEQYAARGFALHGREVDAARDWRRFLAFADVDGVSVPHDRRQRKDFGAVDYATSEPYMLDGLEFGWDQDGRELAWRIYLAQERRSQKTGTLTAVTEDHLDQAPFFIYSSVVADGQAWSVLSPKHEDASNLRNLSVKAAFAWHALYQRETSARLVQVAAQLHEPGKGFYAGRYEKSGEPNRSINCNTNAVVLESLAYIAGGPLLRLRAPGAGS